MNYYVIIQRDNELRDALIDVTDIGKFFTSLYLNFWQVRFCMQISKVSDYEKMLDIQFQWFDISNFVHANEKEKIPSTINTKWKLQSKLNPNFRIIESNMAKKGKVKWIK